MDALNPVDEEGRLSSYTFQGFSTGLKFKLTYTG